MAVRARCARRTVARDYIFDNPPLLGSSRIGPDLANVGSAKWRNEPADEDYQFRPEKRDAAPLASVRAALGLAKRGQDTSNLGELKAKIESNPADHQARIDLATALAAIGEKEDAVSQLLESFRRDRKWNEEAARKQLVEFFEAWGPKDPATLDGRRRLSSLLFS